MTACRKGTYGPTGEREIRLKVGNEQECLARLHEAISNRAYDIYRRRGGGPGHDREDWELAKTEILRPVSCCGILDSGADLAVTLLPAAMGLENITELSICGDPNDLRRLLLLGRTADGQGAYRVIPLQHEVDSTKIRISHRGAVVEVKVAKLGTVRQAA